MRRFSRGRLIRIIFAKLVDQFIRDDPAARSERPKTIDCLRFLYGERLLGGRQSTPGQVRNHLSDSLFFALRPLLCGLKHVIGYVERRSHASDATASRIRCLALAPGRLGTIQSTDVWRPRTFRSAPRSAPGSAPS